jgi:Tfp pilus assembly protein PilZ
MSTGAERRKHRRILIEVELDLVSADNLYAGKARDISMGGLFIDTNVALAVGAPVAVRLVIDAEAHLIPCEVVWALEDPNGRSTGIGLRFLTLEERDRAAIERFMDRRTPLAFEVEPSESGPSGKVPPPLPKS